MKVRYLALLLVLIALIGGFFGLRPLVFNGQEGSGADVHQTATKSSQVLTHSDARSLEDDVEIPGESSVGDVPDSVANEAMTSSEENGPVLSGAGFSDLRFNLPLYVFSAEGILGPTPTDLEMMRLKQEIAGLLEELSPDAFVLDYGKSANLDGPLVLFAQPDADLTAVLADLYRTKYGAVADAE